jgi:hypothetical protein
VRRRGVLLTLRNDRWATRGVGTSYGGSAKPHPAPSAVASDHSLRHAGAGRRPQPGDQRQDFVEYLTRHRDLSHLERDVPPMAGAIGGSEPRAAAKVLDAAGRPSFLGGNFEKPGVISFKEFLLLIFHFYSTSCAIIPW